MKKGFIVLLAFVAMLFVACSSTTSYVASLSGASQSPAVTTNASGSVRATLNGDNQLTVTGDFKDLGSDVTVAHVHRVNNASTQTGPVVFALEITSADRRSGGLSGKSDGALSAADLALLNAGDLYVNVHSEANPDGEIRGFLKR